MKTWYNSKTVRVAIIGLLIALLSVWQQWLSTDAEVSILISSLVTVFLRWLTDQPITSVTPQIDKLRPTIKRKKDSGYYGNNAKSL